MDVPVKLKVFFGVLLAMVITSSVTTGVLMNTMMKRMTNAEQVSDTLAKQMDATVRILDGLQNRVEQVESKQGTTQDLVNTTVTDDNTEMLGADFQDIANALQHLENNVTLCTALMTNQDARISRVESDVTGYQSNLQTINDTLKDFALNISSTKTTFYMHQAKVTKLELDRAMDRTDIDGLLANDTDFEAKIAYNQALIQDLDAKISQLDSGKPTNNITIFYDGISLLEDNITVLDAKVSSLETDYMGYHTNLQSLNSTLAQLALDMYSANALIKIQQTNITQLEQDKVIYRDTIEEIQTNLTELEYKRVLDQALLEGQNRTIEIVKANLSVHGSVIDENTLALVRLETKLDLAHDNIQNVSDKIAIVQTSRISDLAATDDNSRRLSQLETNQNETAGKLINMETRWSHQGSLVGFTVKGPSENTDPRIFQNEVYNSDPGFNMATGKFVCQHPGIYLFSATVNRMPGHEVVGCEISVNGSKKIRAFANAKDQSTEFPSGSTTLVVHLNVGDEVYLTSCTTGTSRFGSETSFSGVLIQPDV